MPTDDSDDVPELDPEDAAGEGSVLDPDDLDFSRDRRVAAIDDNRYVVSPTDDTPNVPDRVTGAGATEPDDSGRAGGSEGVADSGGPPFEEDSGPTGTADGSDLETARRELAASLLRADHDYGFEVAARFGTDVRHEHAASDDVTEAFEALLSWYASGASQETPRADVVGILLADCDLPVRLPTPAVEAAIRASGVSADDSVADLLAAVRESGGLTLGGENHD